jgi:hypothetical protein
MIFLDSNFRFFSNGLCAIISGQIGTYGCCNLHTFGGSEVQFGYSSGKDVAKILKGNKVSKEGASNLEIVDIEDLCV